MIQPITPKIFYAYDNSGSTTIGTSLTDIPFDTVVVQDGIYTLNGSIQLLVSEAGLYRVTYTVTFDETASSAASRVRAVLASASSISGSYSIVDGSEGYGYVTNTGQSNVFSVTRSLVIQATAGMAIKVQALVGSATPTVKTRADATSLLVELMRNWT